MRIRTNRALAAIALASTCLLPAGAYAQETHHGVTFTPSWSGNVLTLEIDAANPTDSWEDATMLGALQIKEVGTWTSLTVTGPDGGTWTLSPDELTANGCTGGSSGGQRACYSGAGIALTDDMLFTFTFTGGVQDLTFPHIKVNMLNAEGEQIGAVSIGRVHAIPEPATYAMLLGGLAVLGAAWRLRRGTVAAVYRRRP